MSGEQCRHCRNGFLDNQFGADVECVNGVLIDIDEATEGWQRDVVYPPAPCIASKWHDGEREGWFEECQRRLSKWGGLSPAPSVGAAIACAASSKGGGDE